MNTKIYKVIIFDADENKHTIDPTIFWDKNAAIKEAEEIRSGNYIPCDTIYVYEEVADQETGAFRTTQMIFKAEK